MRVEVGHAVRGGLGSCIRQRCLRRLDERLSTLTECRHLLKATGADTRQDAGKIHVECDFDVM